MPYSKHKKIIGHETRGKTALNRLRRVDNFLMLYDEEIIRLPSSPKYLYTFIDVGYGAYPYTTLESAWRFRQISPSLYVIGIEIDMERVRFAKEYTDTITDFRHGGFNIPLRKREDGREEKAKCIRAFNVLRQYDEKNVESSYALMAAHLIEGGLIIEGTSDPLGRMWVAHILRKRENRLEREALVFSTNYKAPFHPKTFQTILPKSLIHRVIPGENIYNFFSDWKRAYEQSVHLRIWGDKHLFSHTAKILQNGGYNIDTRKRFLSRGYLIVRNFIKRTTLLKGNN